MGDQSKSAGRSRSDAADIPVTLRFEAREPGDPAERSAPVRCSVMNVLAIYKSMLAGIDHDWERPLRITVTIGADTVTMESDDALELLAKLQHYIVIRTKQNH